MREIEKKGGIDHVSENRICFEHHSICCPLDNRYFGELRQRRVFLKTSRKNVASWNCQARCQPRGHPDHVPVIVTGIGRGEWRPYS